MGRMKCRVIINNRITFLKKNKSRNIHFCNLVNEVFKINIFNEIDVQFYIIVFLQFLLLSTR
jgi:hypothetical protein